MRTGLVILAAILVALPAVAFDLGSRRPAKPAAAVVPPPPDPTVLRQGGDTILDAVMIDWHNYQGTGTTAGYVDDYDEVCPYSGSTSPDVVYTFIADSDWAVTVDLYGSSYDTKVYLYDGNLELVACNDDYYSDYTSKLEFAGVLAGVQYFLVIDGYGGQYGDYQLDVHEYCHGCLIDCAYTGVLEGEPPLANGYVDDWNGGCDTDAVAGPFQPVTDPWFCGKSGWYISASGGDSRDTDWLTFQIPAGGALEITGDAEWPSYMYELGPQDCGTVGVLQAVSIGPCYQGDMIITGDPGATVWFWVGPQAFSSPLGFDVQEFYYVLVSNIEPVAAEVRSWTGVKGLFH